MPISKARKEANKRWDAANMTTIGCRVRRDVAESFKAECMRRGTTINAVFLSAMAAFMEDADRSEDVGGDARDRNEDIAN